MPRSVPRSTGIDLDIYPGERVLIAGPSGSGKSTLAGCINGLNPFSNPGVCTGTLTVDGVDAPHSSIFELSAHVGTVLQDPDGQFIGLTVGEDIAFALENSCMPQEEMHTITRRAAELVGIENHLGYAPHELSGGQKQRVSLAGVMVDQVKILLFDEPLANLDPATGKQTMELIDEIQKKTDTTVLIIEHRLEDVLWRSVDRIVLVNEGRILADLRPDALLSTSLLTENGIREPLYLTALRYAGVDITPEKHPSHVDSLVLNEADTTALRNWFTAYPQPEAAPAPEPLLEVRNLCFGYQKGQATLKNVRFSIGKGEMVSIVGRNGAGKSTLSKLICGFETPDAGEIFLNGKSLAEENIRRRAQHIGYVMQNPNQMISKTMIYDEVALGLQRSGLTEAQDPGKGGTDAQDLWAVSLPELAGVGAELRPEKACHHRQRTGAGPGAYPAGRAYGGPGFPPLHRHHGVPAGAERPGRHGRDDHPRHAPDARIHPAGAGLLRRCTHRGPQPGGRSVRPRPHPAGRTERDQPLHAGQPLRHCARAGICGALHRAGPGGAGTWPLKLF